MIGLLASAATVGPANADQPAAQSSLETVLVTAEGIKQQLEIQQALTGAMSPCSIVRNSFNAT